MTEVEATSHHDTQGRREEAFADGPRTNRGTFLKRLGLTLAAGIGVAGVLATSAFADPGQCCARLNDPNCEDCGSSGCGSGQCICRCDCTGIGDSYCFTGHCQQPGYCESCPC